jgi:hypothetical protein
VLVGVLGGDVTQALTKGDEAGLPVGLGIGRMGMDRSHYRFG